MRRYLESGINRMIIILFSMTAILGILKYLEFRNFIPINFLIGHYVNLILGSMLTLLTVNIILRLTNQRVFNLFQKELEIEQRILLTKLYSISIYALGIGIILYLFGVSLNNITILLGLATTGVAFAIRDIIISFFAWLIILNKKPFRINDTIKIGDDFGNVDRIGMFFVTIIRNDIIIKIPNKNFLDKTTINYSKEISESIDFIVKKIPSDEQMKKIKSLISFINKSEISLITTDTNLKIRIDYRVAIEDINKIRTKIIEKIYPITSKIR